MANGALAIRGMDRETGRYCTDKLAHIRQCLYDIFTTALHSRIMRRDYGSELFRAIDSPMHHAGRLRLVAALVDAASRYEPRVAILAAMIEVNRDGLVVLSYQARTLDQQELEAKVPLTART